MKKIFIQHGKIQGQKSPLENKSCILKLDKGRDQPIANVV